MAKNQFDPKAFLLELSEGIKSAARYPNIRQYRPHESQFKFHSSHKKKRLYIGGNRSGKTTAGVTEAIWRASCTHPYRPDLNALGPTRGRVIAVDFVNGVEKIIFPQYKQWCPGSLLKGGSWENAYDKYLRTLTFANGSTIEFMSYDQDLDKFAGTSRHWIHFDEEPPQPLYVENLARIIDTDGDFWITMTPVEGMTWIYDDLYEHNVNNLDGKVLVIEVNSLENPFLSQGAIENFLDSVDEDETTSRIGGKFVQVGGRIYKNFDPTTYNEETKLGGLHVLREPIDNPSLYFKNWLWVCSLDHGLNNPTAVLWTAFDVNGFAVTFEEHYRREWTVDQHALKIREIVKRHGRPPDLWIADPSITARNGVTGTSIHEEYIKYGIPWTLGNNDVKSGIIRVKKYLNPTKYVGSRTHPLFVDAEDKDKATFPMLRITPNCNNLIAEMKRYRWKTYSNKKLTFENNAYDEPHKKDDHACDSLRYAIMSQPDLFADRDQEHADGSFKSRVDDALASLTGDHSMLSMVGPNNEGIADPYGLTEPTSDWSEGNNLPSNGSGWTYDEHMGVDY